ncbi:hypothetical protein ACLOAV_000342 [Pseudogymnoascus australis]
MESSILGKRSRIRTYGTYGDRIRDRVRQEAADSLAKRAANIEALKLLKDPNYRLRAVPSLPPIEKGKKSIADYFAKPPASANPSSSDTKPSSDQPQEHTHSNLFLSPETPHTSTKPPSRKRRRLTTRPRAVNPTKPQTIKPNKMATPEDYDGPVFSSDSDSSSYDSTWEGSLIGEYATAQGTTSAAKSPIKDRKPTGRARANTFTSTSAKGPGDAGRARSKTKAGGEGMVGEFSDMVHDYLDYFSSVLYTRASTTAPNGSRIPGTVQNNTTAGRDAEKTYPIPAYSDSSSKIEATPARTSTGGNGGGQKENTKPGKLVQTQINLGQNPITTCNVCKFTLNRTVVEDVKAHDKFHQAFVNLAEKLDMDEF